MSRAESAGRGAVQDPSRDPRQETDRASGFDSACSIVDRLLRHGLAAAEPRLCLSRAFAELDIAGRLGGAARVDVMALGKAAPALFAAAEECLKQAGVEVGSGLVVGPEGHLPSSSVGATVEFFEAEHPLPGAKGKAAAHAVLEFVGQKAERSAEDTLLVLLSGGASAMLPAPLPGTTLEDERDLTDRMLRAGADIRALNTLRKRLSQIKGGRLAQASRYPRTLVLVLSDVVGDHLPTIASGPLVADTACNDDVIAITHRYFGAGAETVLELLDRLPRLPATDDRCFDNVEHLVIGGGTQSLEAMLDSASSMGPAEAEQDEESQALVRVVSLGARVEGEARDVAIRLVERTLRELSTLQPGGSLVLLGAGETTVTVRGSGSGGRNQELALAFGLEWHRHGHCRAVADFAFGALGTDGRDGPTDAAGALLDQSTISRLEALGIDAKLELDRNNSNGALGSVDALITTGPSGTNVGDIFALVLLTSRP